MKSLFIQQSPLVVDAGTLSQYHWELGMITMCKNHVKLIFLPAYDNRVVPDPLRLKISLEEY